MEIIPAVDILGGAVVRLRQGLFDDVTVFGDDPRAAVAGWGDEGAKRVHVVDLSGARDGVPDPTMWDALVSTGLAIQLGGGLRSVGDVVAAVAAGVDRVVVGTAAVWDPGLLGEMIGEIGSERLVVALDVRDGRAVGSGWTDSGRPMAEVVEGLVSVGAERALVTGIERDGLMTGPNTEILDIVSDGQIAVIASGGVSRLSDVTELAARGVEGAIVGRALYERVFTYREATEAASLV